MRRENEATVLARFCLARLERFARLAADDGAAATAERSRLAHHAAFSAYRDCRAFGLEREARAVLERAAGQPAAPR